MVLNILTDDEVLQRGLELLGYNLQKQDRVIRRTRIRRFKRQYGSHPYVCAILWEELQTTSVAAANVPEGSNKMRDFDMMLLTLFYLKGYPLEESLAARFQVHEQTGRKWVRYYVKKIAALLSSKVEWPDEWDTTFIISVDCVNFGVNETRHPTLHKDKRYFDQKGGKAGLTYEIALHLWENRVVWVNGPFPPNDGGDRDIFVTHGLSNHIPAGKFTIADKIYKGCDRIALHNSLDTDEVREFKGRARARQESINSRLKSFGCMKQRFRHGIAKHENFFSAVMVLCIIQMENGSPLFNV